MFQRNSLPLMIAAMESESHYCANLFLHVCNRQHHVGNCTHACPCFWFYHGNICSMNWHNFSSSWLSLNMHKCFFLGDLNWSIQIFCWPKLRHTKQCQWCLPCINRAKLFYTFWGYVVVYIQIFLLNLGSDRIKFHTKEKKRSRLKCKFSFL